MPDTRAHRGSHPADQKLFNQAAIEKIIKAVQDFSMLLTKGYAEKSALKLVGDRFSLTERQRLAVKRSSCSDQQLSNRRQTNIELEHIKNQAVVIDGYNVLITVEAALSGAFIFKGRDGCYKDLASIHGTYRKVNETIPAIQIIGQFLGEIGIDKALWLLDSPVSNSGRLKTLLNKTANENNWKWEIRLLTNPDTELINTDMIAASSDGVVLDGCKRWVNLMAGIIKKRFSYAKVIDLSCEE